MTETTPQMMRGTAGRLRVPVLGPCVDAPIEEGRYSTRSEHRISVFVDPYGRILAKTALFETAVVVRDSLPADLTIYSRIGTGGWLCGATAAAFSGLR